MEGTRLAKEEAAGFAPPPEAPLLANDEKVTPPGALPPATLPKTRVGAAPMDPAAAPPPPPRGDGVANAGDAPREDGAPNVGVDMPPPPPPMAPNPEESAPVPPPPKRFEVCC